MDKIECSFEYQVLHDLPGGASKIFYMPNKGPGIGRDGMMIKFFPDHGESWVGIFAFGDMLPNGNCQAHLGPGPNHLTVLTKGDAYIVAPNNPDSFIQVKSCPVIDAIPVPNRNLMLFHDYTEIVAYNENGLAWETTRISWDGIEIEEVSNNTILGKSWDAPNEKYVQFNVDLTDGSHQGGSSPLDYSIS